jgi:hypothetical protein
VDKRAVRKAIIYYGSVVFQSESWQQRGSLPAFVPLSLNSSSVVSVEILLETEDSTCTYKIVL